MEEELQQEALSFHHKSPDGQSAHSVQDEINVEFLNVLRYKYTVVLCIFHLTVIDNNYTLHMYIQY